MYAFAQVQPKDTREPPKLYQVALYQRGADSSGQVPDVSYSGVLELSLCLADQLVINIVSIVDYY